MYDFSHYVAKKQNEQLQKERSQLQKEQYPPNSFVENK